MRWYRVPQMVGLLLLAVSPQIEMTCRAEESNGTIPNVVSASTPLTPGDHVRRLVVDEINRSAIVHIPPQYTSEKPMALVLALHGAAMNGEAMVRFCGMNKTADDRGFVVVYPDGTAPGPLLTWNAGGFQDGVGSRADDVKFLGKLIDDIGTVVSVDPKRVYACGMSNGGMMCYRLAAEMSDRIAAIAPVAGTMPAIMSAKPTRAVSVVHFHGTNDPLVPFELAKNNSHFWLKLRSVDDSIAAWCKIDGCTEEQCRQDRLSKEGDELEVTRFIYGPGKDDSEVALVKIEGGGHTWPGMVPPVRLLGKSALDISANALIWDFFEKHPLK